MKQNKPLRRLVEISVIAALYSALTLTLPSFSYGLIQVRFSELLTILPLFTPAAIPGLTIGCAISNFVGMAFNPAGAWDVIFGTITTLIAALMTKQLANIKLKGLPIVATLPPVILNAIVIGLELTIAIHGFSWPLYIVAIAQVGIGQFLSCTIGGLFLYTALSKSGAAKRLFN